MSDSQDRPESSYFDQVNDDLSSSLRRCRALVDDCRLKLAANSNDPEAANDESEASEQDEA